MKKNIGKIDKFIRVIIATVAIIMLAMGYVALSSTLGIVLAVVAGIMLFTSLVNNCPLYSIVGVSTCERD